MDLYKYLLNFAGDFVKILSEMAPYLLLGFFFAGILYAFITPRNIERYFNGNPLKSSLLAAFFGIPLPLCSCGVIPTGTAFYKNGASKGGTVSFLISTPQTGVDSILATYSLLGLPFAIIRPIAALITGVTGGIITGVVTNNQNITQPSGDSKTKNKTLKEKIKSVFQYGFIDFIQDISKWLIIGLLLAALISALIPNHFFELMNVSPIFQMLFVLILSIPLYICATGSIPLAAVLILKGLNPGAAFVLLMAGPATNVATITMIGKVLGRKSLIIYLSTIITGAFSFGLIINYILPLEWFTSIAQNHLNHIHNNGLNWWQISSGILLTMLIINGYLQKFINQKQITKNNKIENLMDIVTIKVEGMTCNHCKANVESNLEKLPFVKSAIVNLADNSAHIEGNFIDIEKVKETINGLGYKYIE